MKHAVLNGYMETPGGFSRGAMEKPGSPTGCGSTGLHTAENVRSYPAGAPVNGVNAPL